MTGTYFILKLKSLIFWEIKVHIDLSGILPASGEPGP